VSLDKTYNKIVIKLFIMCTLRICVTPIAKDNYNKQKGWHDYAAIFLDIVSIIDKFLLH